VIGLAVRGCTLLVWVWSEGVPAVLTLVLCLCSRPQVFGFFTITPWGVPYAVWGMAYIIIFSK
jgi:hypothetical protein